MSSVQSPNELSFLPDDYLERKARRRAIVLCGVLSIVVMGIILSAFMVTEQSLRALDTQLDDADKQYAAAAVRIAEVQKLHSAQRQIAMHAELAETLVEKVPRTNILAELTNALPHGVSLIDFYLETSPVDNPKPGEDKTKVKMRLTGVADNDNEVGQFLGALGSSKLFIDVNPLISDSFLQDKTTLRRFQIEMYLNQKADVSAAKSGKPASGLTTAGLDPKE